MKIQNSFDLLLFLRQEGFIFPKDSLWWPHAGSFEVLLGAIFVQNTKWEQASRALERLRERDLLHLCSIASLPLELLQELISNLGFFRQKAKRSIQICQNILHDFGSFENFCAQVDRPWLLAQKGIGNETCDSILLYGALREEMVVDAYTHRLLSSFGYELSSYDEIKEWLIEGLKEHYAQICMLYGYEISLPVLYARLHGKIVEYAKSN